MKENGKANTHSKGAVVAQRELTFTTMQHSEDGGKASHTSKEHGEGMQPFPADCVQKG